MSLSSLAFWAIVVPWLQYLPEIHFWCVYELRDMSQHAVCCVSMRFLWWCIMYYHHYALYYDKSCQCAVQCTVILILLPVMWRPHFWIPLMMMTMEVAERAHYCDSSILSDWRVKSHGWRVKKKKNETYCYNTNTNWKFQTHWMLKNRDHWWASIATQFRAERKLFAKKTFSWKEIYLLEIVIKFCRKRTQISFSLLMYICQEVERKVIALWWGNVKVDAGM